jgi:hypothetical protein
MPSTSTPTSDAWPWASSNRAPNLCGNPLAPYRKTLNEAPSPPATALAAGRNISPPTPSNGYGRPSWLDSLWRKTRNCSGSCGNSGGDREAWPVAKSGTATASCQEPVARVAALLTTTRNRCCPAGSRITANSLRPRCSLASEESSTNGWTISSSMPPLASVAVARISPTTSPSGLPASSCSPPISISSGTCASAAPAMGNGTASTVTGMGAGAAGCCAATADEPASSTAASRAGRRRRGVSRTIGTAPRELRGDWRRGSRRHLRDGERARRWGARRRGPARG